MAMARRIWLGVALGAATAVACGGAQPSVSGVALDLRGQPLAGVQVRVGSLPAVVTDAAGRFTVPGAPATYDAALVVQLPQGVLPQGSPPVRAAIVYQGLKRRDPTLWLPRIAVKSDRFFTFLSLSLTGAESGPEGLFVLTDPLGNRAAWQYTSSPPTALRWFGDATSATLTALRLADPPTAVIAAGGHLAVPPLAGGSYAVPVVTAAPFVISGSTTWPAACAPAERVLIVPTSLGEGAGLVMIDSTRSVAYSLNVGWTDEVPLAVVASTRCGATMDPNARVVRRLRTEVTTYALDLTEPPRLTAPEIATLATSFSWTTAAPALSLVRFQHIDRNGYAADSVHVVTAATSATFPDLRAFASGPTPGQGYDVGVEAWDGMASADAAAGAGGLRALLGNEVDGRYGASEISPTSISP